MDIVPLVKSQELKVKQHNPQLEAVVELHSNELLANFVLQLDPLSLETTKMMLLVLRQVEATCAAQLGRPLQKQELSAAADLLIKDASARQQIVELYQQQRLRALTPDQQMTPK